MTLGALTARGRDGLVSYLQTEIEEVAGALDKHLGEAVGKGAESLIPHIKGLKLAARLELLRARAELLREGNYTTIPLSGNTAESIPREPSGVISATYGAYEVEGGELGQVMLWVERDKCTLRREVRESLRGEFGVSRERWVAEFNASDSEWRRAWFDRYQMLSSMRGVAAMTNRELADWMVLQQKVRFFGLRLSGASLTVY